MLTKKLNQTLLAGLVIASTSLSANAGHDRYEDRARVISVTPQVERINTPVQECRTEYVRESYYEPETRSNTGAIIGGVAGGLIGSRFGGGSGRIATAALGAGIGAVIGDRHDNRYARGHERVETRPVERCTTVDHWETVNRGYLVDYEYNGRQYTTETLEHPGRYIPVNVSVRPNGHITRVEHHYYKPDNKYHKYHRKHHYKKHHEHDRDYYRNHY